jgi:hypothetical protein
LTVNTHIFFGLTSIFIKDMLFKKKVCYCYCFSIKINVLKRPIGFSQTLSDLSKTTQTQTKDLIIGLD